MRVGANIDGFVLVRILGESLLGTTWLAREARRNTQAVLKLLATPSRSEFSRLVAKLKATATITHPNLQTVLRSVQAPELNALGLAAEFVEGSTLTELELDPRKLLLYLRWFEQLARALMVVHAAGVVHGAIKASNIAVDKNGDPKLLELTWSQLTAPQVQDRPLQERAVAQLEDVRALMTLLDDRVLRKLRSVPSALLRVRASSASELATALETARHELEDEPTDRKGQLALPARIDSFGDEPDTVRVSVESNEAVQEVRVGASSMALALIGAEQSATVPSPAIRRRFLSPLAAWGLVLWALSALITVSSSLWFDSEARAKATRSVAFVEQGGAPAAADPLPSELPDRAALPELAAPAERANPVRTIDPVTIQLKNEPGKEARARLVSAIDASDSGDDGPDAGSKKKAVLALEVGCDEGDGDACLKLGDLLWRESASTDRALASWERACKFGYASGCVKGGDAAEASGADDVARSLRARACKLGNAASCADVSDTSTSF